MRAKQKLKETEKKRYVVQKLVMAVSATEAMQLEKKSEVDAVFLDANYVKPKSVGFITDDEKNQ